MKHEVPFLLGLLIVVSLLTGCGLLEFLVGRSDEQEESFTISHIQSAVWLVVGQNDLSPPFSATAFAVAPDLLATNGHVTEALKDVFKGPNPTAMVFRHGTGESRQITTVWTHPDFDLRQRVGKTPDVGLLKVDAMVPTVLTLADDETLQALSLFQGIGTCGYPGSLVFEFDLIHVITDGSVTPQASCYMGAVSSLRAFGSDVEVTPENAAVLEVEVSGEPGTSGSPLFNDQGDVIGIVHAGFITSTALGIRADHIRDLLEQAEANQVEGVVLADIEPLGLDSNEGICFFSGFLCCPHDAFCDFDCPEPDTDCGPNDETCNETALCCDDDTFCDDDCPEPDSDCLSCGEDGQCVSFCPDPDPDCSLNGETCLQTGLCCSDDALCDSDCPEEDSDCSSCGADGQCIDACPEQDPDCGPNDEVCFQTGECCPGDGICDGDSCPEPDADPDCGPNGAICVETGFCCPDDGFCDGDEFCPEPDSDCSSCEMDGVCIFFCPELDPDCSDDDDLCFLTGFCCPDDGFCDGGDLCPDPDPDCSFCEADGLCISFCPEADPDCSPNEEICLTIFFCCDGDGICDTECPDPDLDCEED